MFFLSVFFFFFTEKKNYPRLSFPLLFSSPLPNEADNVRVVYGELRRGERKTERGEGRSPVINDDDDGE